MIKTYACQQLKKESFVLFVFVFSPCFVILSGLFNTMVRGLQINVLSLLKYTKETILCECKLKSN